MLEYKRVSTDRELYQLLDLQKRNLKSNLTPEEINLQGFVTVNHSFEDIQKMHSIAPSVIAKDGDEVVAYAIAMTEASKADIPILVPMFDMFAQIDYLSKKITEYNYMVVGQVCVDYKYRGQKVFDNTYGYYKSVFEEKYDFAITEIALENIRSLKAHARVGFKTIHEFRDTFGIDWAIVLWDFQT
jgi:hypothetical protein